MAHRILLVDDHALFRAGLAMILAKEPAVEVARQVADGAEAIAVLEQSAHGIDLVLLDINLPDQSGLDVARRVREFDAIVKILMVTMYEDKAYLKAALDSGANGYITKEAVDEELIVAVREVLAGRKYIHPKMVDLLLSEEDSKPKGGNAFQVPLSARELDVLRYIALGYTQREIGEALFISEKTVETYKSRLLQKLGFKRRSELVRYAFENGLVQCGPSR